MITAEHLTRRYGPTTAVDDLSFTVRPGLVTGFLGPNGAGKSTTMRMILGLERPTAGSVTIGGHRYSALPAPMRHVGALLDAGAVHPGRSAYHHLLALAQTHGIGAGRVREVLGLAGLELVSDRRCGELSLGMGQRLGLAAALLGDPGVLLLDEPVNGLDPDGIVWIRTLIRSLAAEGRTVLVSSHLMSEMALTADRVLVIGRGRLIADAAVADLLAASQRSGVQASSPQPDALTAAVRAAGARVEAEPDGSIVVHGLDAASVGDLAYREGIRLHQLTTRLPSLEQAYLDLTSSAIEHRGGTTS